jgi:hypothetical protein
MDEKDIAVLSSLPIEKLVAAPVISTARAQIMLSQEFANFIQSIGLDKDGNIRMMPFVFDAPTIGDDGKPTGETRECKIQAPFIALTGVPNFAIEELAVDFSIKIDHCEQSELKNSPDQGSHEAESDTSLSNIKGRVSQGTSQTRKTDTDARYNFKLTAKKQAPPEALMKILDMLTEITIKLREAKDEKITT